MATCDPQALLNSANCFDCLTNQQLEQVQVQMLCDLVNGGLAGGPFVRISGDTMTGDLVINARLGIGTSPTAQFDLLRQSSFAGDECMLVRGNLIGASIFGHAFADNTFASNSVGGGYASYDAAFSTGGTANWNHVYSFQGRPAVGGNVGTMSTYVSQPSVTGAVTTRHGIHIYEATGAGTIQNNYGIYIEDHTKGALANYGIFADTTAPCFLGGDIQGGGRLTMSAGGANKISYILGTLSVARTSPGTYLSGWGSGGMTVGTTDTQYSVALISKSDSTLSGYTFANENALDEAAILYDHVARKMFFSVARGLRFVIGPTGNAGLYTLTPQSKLDIVGNLTVGATYGGANAAPTSGAIIEGRVGIGTNAPTATALLDLVSTTLGFKLPNMTSAQKNAIANTAGLMVFDTDLGKACVNSGSGWQTITSV